MIKRYIKKKLELEILTVSFKNVNKYFDIASGVNNQQISGDKMEDNVSCKN